MRQDNLPGGQRRGEIKVSEKIEKYLEVLKFIEWGNFRLVDRFLIDGYKPQRLSTYALSLFRHRTTVNGEKVLVGE